MPTFAVTDRFRKDLTLLDPKDRLRLQRAIAQFVEELSSRDRRGHPGLRVKRVQGAEGVFELTWAPDGRATFEFGREIRPGEPHIVWRRVGTHDILGRP
jgi:hypothetical protein